MTAWLSLAATIVGALVAISGGILNDFFKTRRDDRKAMSQDKYKITIEFILAANRAVGFLRRVNKNDIEAASLAAVARNAVGNSGLYDAREQVLMSAPHDIAVAAERAFQAIRAIRDIIGGGTEVNSLEYRQAYMRYSEAIWSVRQNARANLGIDVLDLTQMMNIDYRKNAEGEASGAVVVPR